MSGMRGYTKCTSNVVTLCGDQQFPTFLSVLRAFCSSRPDKIVYPVIAACIHTSNSQTAKSYDIFTFRMEGRTFSEEVTDSELTNGEV